MLSKVRHYVPLNELQNIYYAIFSSIVLYGAQIWSQSLVTVSDYSFPPSTPLFFREKLLKVQDIFKIRIAKFIYNSLNKTSPANFHLWFKLTTQVHNHHTRSQYIDILTNNLFIPTARTSHYGLKLIKVQGPKIWNDIPPSIRNITVSNIFITKLKKSNLESYNIQVLGD